MAGAGKRRFNRTEKPRAGKKELAKWEAIKEQRNRCFDRTKEHGSARIPGLPTEPFAGYDYLSGEGETITASHTEILTVPRIHLRCHLPTPPRWRGYRHGDGQHRSYE